jgi:hypothetical protein
MADLAGMRFGNWTVEGRSPTDYTSIDHTKRRIVSKPMWICRCDCGTVDTVIESNLTSGRSTKCRRCRDKLRAKGASRYMKELHRLKSMHPEVFLDV